MARARAIAAVAAALTVVSCGGADEGDDRRTRVEPAPFGDLLARVPARERSAIALDVAAARRELGLPADAGTGDRTDGQRRLRAMVAATVLNYPIRDDGPLDRAIDYRRVTGLLRVDGPPEVLLVATRQPWNDLRRALAREGWRPVRGGVLERPARGGAPVLRWVAGRDGLLVAGGDPRLAPRVLDRREPTSRPLRALLGATAGPARAARLLDGRCVSGQAAGYSPADAAGAFVIAVDDVPPLPYRTARVRRLPDGFELQRPYAAGGRVSVPFTFEAASDPTVQPAALARASAPLFAYRC